MVASLLDSNDEEAKVQYNEIKSQQLKTKQSVANWALFPTCISSEKNHENTIISPSGEGTHRRRKKGKMLVGLFRNNENVSRMKNALKT